VCFCGEHAAAFFLSLTKGTGSSSSDKELAFFFLQRNGFLITLIYKTLFPVYFFTRSSAGRLISTKQPGDVCGL
jgi:hypothetical protein